VKQRGDQKDRKIERERSRKMNLPQNFSWKIDAATEAWRPHFAPDF
jgi:hypothetical protein